MTPQVHVRSRADSLRAATLSRRASVLAAVLALLALQVPVALGAHHTDPVGENDPFESDVQEYAIKAAMTEKFVRYVGWPKERFDDARAPIVVGVYGKDPFGEALDKAFDGRESDGRPFKIRRVTQLGDCRACHVLYVPANEVARAPEIAKAVKGAGVLLIGESPGFALTGGIINFYLDDQKLRFEVNPEAAKRQKLTISSNLLKLARIVEEESE